MFDIKYITKVRAAVARAVAVLGSDNAVETLRHCAWLGVQEMEVQKTFGTVLAAICFCSFLYPIATPALPADRA